MWPVVSPASAAPDQRLYVLTSYFNPRAWQSRLRLYQQFKSDLDQACVPLVTVEIAFADRPHAATRAGDPWALRLRTRCELWHKERALNLGMAWLCQLVPDWKYVAWMDADVRLNRPFWWLDAVEALHHYPVVQLFTQARQLLPDHTVQFSCPSFAETYRLRGAVEVATTPDMSKKPRLGHPGLGWAFRRETLEGLGGLLDTCVNGSGDTHMAFTFIGEPGDGVPRGCSPGYARSIARYASRARVHVGKRVGAIPGCSDHYWHGKSRERGYETRRDILVHHQFDPDTDLVVDVQGLHRWAGNKPAMELELKHSLASRNEDSVDS